LEQKLVVALGERRYVVERPWGRWPTPGKVTDVAVCSRGHVFVLLRGDPYVDELADCVVELDGGGRFLGSWGQGRILDAHKIACDDENRIWVVDRDAHEVACFDRAGRELMTLGTRLRPLEPFNHPSDVAFAPDGTILVADGYAGGCVRRFDQRGRELHAWGEVGVEPGAFLTVHGVWAMRDGRVAVADRENGRVQVFHADGRLEAIWTGFHRPSDIWGDQANRLYISDGVPALTLLDAQGRREGRCRPVLNGAHGICGDGSGRLYLAEGNPSRLTRLCPID
jgi:peptidylglycine monooxygenase